MAPTTRAYKTSLAIFDRRSPTLRRVRGGLGRRIEGLLAQRSSLRSQAEANRWGRSMMACVEDFPPERRTCPHGGTKQFCEQCLRDGVGGQGLCPHHHRNPNGRVYQAHYCTQCPGRFICNAPLGGGAPRCTRRKVAGGTTCARCAKGRT